MKLGLIFLLVAASNAYTPIKERTWLRFAKVKEPTYNTISMHELPNIIQATHIDIEERIDTLATMVRKSVLYFQDHIKKYTAEVTKRVRRATQGSKGYGFVRKLELRHQYGMLFNHHGQVISGLLSTWFQEKQPRTNDGTEYQHKRVFGRGHTHYGMYPI